MRDLELKLEKLEKVNITDKNFRDKVLNFIKEENLHPIESTGLLLELGLVDVETIINLIVVGGRNKSNILEENSGKRIQD